MFLKCDIISTSSIIPYFKKELIMGNIEYDKYINMSRRQLVNALTNAELKEKKIKEELNKKLEDASNLVKFLKSKLKESLEDSEQKDEPKFYTLETSPALKKIDKWAKENPELAAQIDKEFEEEMKGYYDNTNTK